MKKCPKCGKTKEYSEFGKSVSRKDGLTGHCKGCISLYHAGRYLKDHEWRRRVQGDLIRRKYGLTKETWTDLFQKQGGVCDICKKIPTGKRGLGVDHDHSTGKVRGLLCSPCNTALGMLKESISVAESLIQYIEKHSG